MKILSYKQLDDCVGGSYYNEVQFDKRLNSDDIESFKGLGDLEFHRDFARPYFQLRASEGFMLKGLQNDDTVRLILMGCSMEDAIKKLEVYLTRNGD